MTRKSSFLARIPINGFLVGLFIAVGFAWVLPGPGVSGGVLHSDISTKVGIMMIFFFQGWILPTEDLKDDILEWRLHLFIQGFNFVIVPLLVLFFTSLMVDFLDSDLMVGFLFLAILPTTVSTCVVFTTIAGGNVAAAIFNASLSNIIGVFIVPAWSAWLLTATTGEAVPVGPLIVNIAWLLLLPLIAGQVVRPFTKNVIPRFRKSIGKMNTFVILFIIYVAFAKSFQTGIWAERGIYLTVSAMGLSCGLLVIVKSLVWTSTLICRFDSSGRITAFFCGSQKTLAAGVPMAQSIFSVAGLEGGSPTVGVVLLPLMCYHFLQLAVGGFLLGFFKSARDS